MTEIAGYGRYLQRSYLGRSLLIEGTSSRNSLIVCSVKTYSLFLPGIGYFTLSVKGKLYQDPRSGHYRLRDPEARTVKFRPDTEMMEALLHTEFENVTYRQGVSSIPTYKEIDEAIARLGTDRPFFSVDDLRLSLNLSQANAYRIAARLVEEGKIKNIGKGRNKLYVLGEHDAK